MFLFCSELAKRDRNLFIFLFSNFKCMRDSALSEISREVFSIFHKGFVKFNDLTVGS